MSETPSLEELWDTVPGRDEAPAFEPGRIEGLPAPAVRYLAHAIAPGTRLARAVRLKMHGEIKLGRWVPFEAEQVIRWDRGMIWRARTRGPLSFRGADRVVDGEGALRFKLFGIVPVMTAQGPDVTRSALGRMHMETLWLPSVLVQPGVTWTERGDTHADVVLACQGEESELHLEIDQDGRLRRNHMKRWGNPGGGAHHLEDFGGIMDAEGTFDGYTIPTSVRVGWFFGTPRFQSEGEFFRGHIDHAQFR